MAQQNTGGFGVANPVPYTPENVDIKDPPDTLPSEQQPLGVDAEDDFPQSLEEALLGA